MVSWSWKNTETGCTASLGCILNAWTFGVLASMLSQHGAIPRWQIATRHAGASRLQEEKLKVRPRNVNTRRAPAIPVPARARARARHRFEERNPKSSPALGGWCTKVEGEEERRRKKGGRKRETPIAYRAVERDKSNEDRDRKNGRSHSTVNWIEISDLAGLSLGLVPDLVSITTTSSLPTDYRVRTTSHERSTDRRCGAMHDGVHLEDDVAETLPSARSRNNLLAFPSYAIIMRISAGKIAKPLQKAANVSYGRYVVYLISDIFILLLELTEK